MGSRGDQGGSVWSPRGACAIRNYSGETRGSAATDDGPAQVGAGRQIGNGAAVDVLGGARRRGGDYQAGAGGRCVAWRGERGGSRAGAQRRIYDAAGEDHASSGNFCGACISPAAGDGTNGG